MLFVAKKNVGNSLRRSCQLDDDSEAVNLSQDANIVHEDMLPFSSSFTEDCQEHSVPQSLVMLITMIIYGTNINDLLNEQGNRLFRVFPHIWMSTVFRRSSSLSICNPHTC